MRRGSLVRIVALGVVIGVAVTLVAVLIPWLPTSASEEMDRISFVFWFTTIISIVIFAIVAALILYSVVAFRARPDDDADGAPIHGNTNLEIAWTAIPAVLVIAIGVVSAVVLAKNGDAGTNPLQVKVFAQQFAWRFEYPEQDGLKTGELVLPVDRSVRFEMQSADVIHSFWIPQMGQKQDLVPGIATTIVVTPTRTGDFALICTELCGLGHATMRAPVRVLEQAEWEAWVRQEQVGGGGGAGEGAQLFASQGCGGCHALAKAGADAEIGPSLELDSLQAGADAAGQPLEEFVRQSIVDPGAAIASGYQDGVMPSTYGETMDQQQLDALVGYLATAEE